MSNPFSLDFLALFLVFAPGFFVWLGFFVFRFMADRAGHRRPRILDAIGWQKGYAEFLRIVGWFCLGFCALYISLLLSALTVGLAPLDVLPTGSGALVLGGTFLGLLSSTVFFAASRRSTGRKSEAFNLVGLLLVTAALTVFAAYQIATQGFPFLN